MDGIEFPHPKIKSENYKYMGLVSPCWLEGSVEYTDWIPAEGEDSPTSVLDMTLILPSPVG